MRNIQREYYVYILASKRLGILYVGVTSNLDLRVYQHRNDILKGFTKRYGVHRLVYFEVLGDIRDAIAREKQLKGWNRAWKIRLIEKQNPEWKDCIEAAKAVRAMDPLPSRTLFACARRG